MKFFTSFLYMPESVNLAYFNMMILLQVVGCEMIRMI